LPLFGKIAVPSSSTSNNPRKVLKSEVFGQLDSEGEGIMIISNLLITVELIPQVSSFRHR